MVCTPARSNKRSVGKRPKKSTPSRRELREIAPPAVANPPAAPTARPELTQPGELRPPSISYRRDGQGRASATRNYASSDGELSPEERLRLAAFREEQQAIASPTAIGGNSATSSGNASSLGSD